MKVLNVEEFMRLNKLDRIKFMTEIIKGSAKLQEEKNGKRY